MPTIEAKDLKVGDTIYCLGHSHRITHIDPPTARTLVILPGCIGYAYARGFGGAEKGWGITLTTPDMEFDVDG
jgi:hypothetical protein